MTMTVSEHEAMKNIQNVFHNMRKTTSVTSAPHLRDAAAAELTKAWAQLAAAAKAAGRVPLDTPDPE